MSESVGVYNKTGLHPIVLVCEHASAFIPDSYKKLGLNNDQAKSHIAWDPGAFDLAKSMADELDAVLVHGKVSRLLYDCNRPPHSVSAITQLSEVHPIPGNVGLSETERSHRENHIYWPFTKMLQNTLNNHQPTPIVVTVHSFTPTYRGLARDTEIGVLHDKDSRLADALINASSVVKDFVVHRNKPYGPDDGVTHTLIEHGINENRFNVMLEVRNDCIHTKQQQASMASAIVDWLNAALKKLPQPALPGVM